MISACARCEIKCFLAIMLFSFDYTRLFALSKSKVTLTTPNACVTIPSGLLFHDRIFPHRRGADKSFICILNRRKDGLSRKFSSSVFSQKNTQKRQRDHWYSLRLFTSGCFGLLNSFLKKVSIGSARV